MQNIPLDTFNAVMEDLANKFARELKVSLMMPYPYAPGYSKQRSPFGTSNKIASGSLLESISASYNPTNKEITVEMLDYWQYVNNGREPGKYVPLDSIKSWIKDRGLKGRDAKTGRFIPTESFAWGINTNIKKFGIAPTNFYDRAIESFEQYFEDDMVRALGIDIDNFFDNLFDKSI